MSATQILILQIAGGVGTFLAIGLLLRLDKRIRGAWQRLWRRPRRRRPIGELMEEANAPQTPKGPGSKR